MMVAFGHCLGFFENLKPAGCSHWGSKVDQQISERSNKRFKSYCDFKNPVWLPSCGRHLGFFYNLKVACNRPFWSEVGHQITKFGKDQSSGLKGITISTSTEKGQMSLA
jgi:hypothetical protein